MPLLRETDPTRSSCPGQAQAAAHCTMGPCLPHSQLTALDTFPMCSCPVAGMKSSAQTEGNQVVLILALGKVY